MKNFILKLINNVPDETSKYSNKDIEDGKDLGVLCYIMPIIPYFLNKKNKFVKYHSIIGMNLLIITIFYYIIFKMISSFNINIIALKITLTILWLILLLLSCIGISNVCSGKARELPIINRIKIFK